MMLAAIEGSTFYVVLIPLAILVFWFGNRRLQRQIGKRNGAPRGLLVARSRTAGSTASSAASGYEVACNDA